MKSRLFPALLLSARGLLSKVFSLQSLCAFAILADKLQLWPMASYGRGFVPDELSLREKECLIWTFLERTWDIGRFLERHGIRLRRGNHCMNVSMSRSNEFKRTGPGTVFFRVESVSYIID